MMFQRDNDFFDGAFVASFVDGNWGIWWGYKDPLDDHMAPAKVVLIQTLGDWDEAMATELAGRLNDTMVKAKEF